MEGTAAISRLIEMVVDAGRQKKIEVCNMRKGGHARPEVLVISDLHAAPLRRALEAGGERKWI